MFPRYENESVHERHWTLGFKHASLATLMRLIHHLPVALTLLASVPSGASTISLSLNNVASGSSGTQEVPLNVPRSNLTGFSITVNFTGTAPPPSQQLAFTNAANAWMSRIIGYRGGMTVPTVSITAAVAPNDGVNGILGFARPTFASIQFENGASGTKFALVTQGEMSFDSADIAALEAGGLLGTVIEHEMGHVLGIGTVWNTNSLGGVFTGTQALYAGGSGQFTGAAALAQWRTEFGQPGAAFVPVELGGGEGTADGHWNEFDGGGIPTGITQTGTDLDMRNELMTGWLDGPSFVSQMTLASLYDIGYQVIPEPHSLALIALCLPLGVFRRKVTR